MNEVWLSSLEGVHGWPQWFLRGTKTLTEVSHQVLNITRSPWNLLVAHKELPGLEPAYLVLPTFSSKNLWQHFYLRWPQERPWKAMRLSSWNPASLGKELSSV